MQDKNISIQLLAMARADQLMRHRAVHDTSHMDETVDKEHAEELKRIIETYGWPTVSLVGKPASRAAWLLAQHADHDVLFQERCLRLMKQAPPGEVQLADVAYLEDRVRCAQGRPQLYGTQFDNPGTRFGPKAVQDRAHLDQRRTAMGLSSFEEYRRSMITYYGNSPAA
jgi:hypothetical protein